MPKQIEDTDHGDSSLFAPAASQSDSTVAISQQSRQVSEVQVALVIAKRFPRDEITSLSKLKRSCQRPKLAAMATYAYKKGDSTIDGPSIRLAEAAAQAWGNIDHGWIELDRRMAERCGESSVMAYAWDLENNTRKVLVFTVRHWRDTKKGGYALKDERDIYELCANQAARRIRSCILSIIPGDIIDEALDECEKTLKHENKGKPIADRARDMMIAFDGIGINREQIEARLQKKAEAITEPELRQLQKVFVAIRDGIGKAGDYFEVAGAEVAKPKFENKPPTPEDKARFDREAREPHPEAIRPPERATARQATPLEGLANLCAASGVTQERLVSWLSGQGEDIGFFADIEEATAKNLIKNWAKLVPQILGEANKASTTRTDF
jgi:ribosomal protein S27AE